MARISTNLLDDDEPNERPVGDDRQPRYAGEDTRPTSRKELAGWYSYGWAAEVFVVCAMGIGQHFITRVYF